MDKSITEQLKKITLVEELLSIGFSEQLAEGVVESILNPEEPAYICNDSKDLHNAIVEMSTISEE